MIKAHLLQTNVNTNTPYHKTSTLKVLNTYILYYNKYIFHMSGNRNSQA